MLSNQSASIGDCALPATEARQLQEQHEQTDEKDTHYPYVIEDKKPLFAAVEGYLPFSLLRKKVEQFILKTKKNRCDVGQPSSSLNYILSRAVLLMIFSYIF